MTNVRIFVLVVLVVAGIVASASAEEDIILVDDIEEVVEPVMQEPEPVLEPEVKLELEASPARPSWGHRILWYIPNRLLDLVDIVRLRARVGPGNAISLQMTDNANIYAGQYRSVFVGLPGPRREPAIRRPYGFEQEKGLMFMGVDATDDLPNQPGYSSTEFDLGVHVLFVGAEAGFDPVEFWDFFAGLLFFDPVGDDR